MNKPIPTIMEQYETEKKRSKLLWVFILISIGCLLGYLHFFVGFNSWWALIFLGFALCGIGQFIIGTVNNMLFSRWMASNGIGVDNKKYSTVHKGTHGQ
jgi:hypothetical protein